MRIICDERSLWWLMLERIERTAKGAVSGWLNDESTDGGQVKRGGHGIGTISSHRARTVRRSGQHPSCCVVTVYNYSVSRRTPYSVIKRFIHGRKACHRAEMARMEKVN